MNAPSLSIQASQEDGRDLFAAYVTDEATATVLKAAAADQNWPGDRVELGGVQEAIRALSVTSSPHFLIIDLSESEDPHRDINALAEVCEPGTIVLAIGQINDVRLYRELIASGLQDYLIKPVDIDTVREAFMTAEMTLTQPQEVAEPESREDHVCAFIGVRGGVGASTITSACAWIAAHELNKKVALLDLDVHYGTGALSFDLEPGRGLCDALENPGRVDSLFLERATIKESENLAILGAEAPIADPMMPDPSALGHLQLELKQSYNAVLIDWPRSMLPSQTFLAGQMTDVVVVADLSLAAARDTIRVLSFLKEHAPQAKVHLVINKAGNPNLAELTRKDFEASVERKIDLIIPLDAKNAIAAAKKGTALPNIAKSAKASNQLRQLAQQIAGAPETTAKTGFMEKLNALLRKPAKAKNK